MDKSEKTKDCPKNGVPKKRRGRPPKYPDVWGKPCSPPFTETKDNIQAATEANKLASLPVQSLCSPPQPNQHHLQASPPLSDDLDSNSSHSDRCDLQFLGTSSMHVTDKSRKRQGRPRGSYNRKHPGDVIDDPGTQSTGAMVVTEEELLRLYYESGGRDVKHFPQWVQAVYQGRVHPIKMARLDDPDDSETCSKATVMIVENQEQTCQVSPSSVMVQPVTISPNSPLLQPRHQAKQPTPFHSQQNIHSFSTKRTYDRTVSPVSPTVQRCGIVKPSCLVQNNDVALDLSTSGIKRCSKDKPVKSHLKNIESWDTDEVCQFVSEVANCQSYAQVFKEHVIDGQLLLELSESQMMNHLHMKLGPAMHLRRAIEKLTKNLE